MICEGCLESIDGVWHIAVGSHEMLVCAHCLNEMVKDRNFMFEVKGGMFDEDWAFKIAKERQQRIKEMFND